MTTSTWIREKMLEFSSTVLTAPSPYHFFHLVTNIQKSISAINSTAHYMAYTQNADEVIVRHAVWFDTMKHPKMPTQCHAVTLA